MSPTSESSILKNETQLFLAPMEGVTDFIMRDLLTEIGGIDFCVTEFLRVTDSVYPDHVFYKMCPELNLKTDSNFKSRTRSGTPVLIQLLGGNAEPLAANALKAAELGAYGIDLNFGCPAPTVNRHDGGATLLKSSERLFNIVKSVRNTVPSGIPVSAKIRLGFDDPSQCLENAKAIEEAGASWLTVHCRTKLDGYKPPAYWEWIPKIKEKTKLKIIANGDIWTPEDFKKCQEITRCHQFMIGRGALKSPYLFNQIKNNNKTPELSKNITDFFNNCENNVSGEFAVARTKQWLNQLRTNHPHLEIIFEKIKIIRKPSEFKLNLKELLTSYPF